MKRFFLLLLSVVIAVTAVAEKTAKRLKPLKGRIVVLTFDDATAGQREVVAPLLHKYGFGATFYVCEFPGFEDKTKYMSWDQIRELDEMGFEIGNHSRSHGQMSQMTRKQIGSETAYIEDKCALYGIPRPVTYAYPGYDNSPEGIAVLKERGYKLARHGGDKPYVKGVSDKADAELRRGRRAVRDARIFRKSAGRGPRRAGRDFLPARGARPRARFRQHFAREFRKIIEHVEGAQM